MVSGSVLVEDFRRGWTVPRDKTANSSSCRASRGAKPGFGAAYLRFIPRNEMDIAAVGVGAAVQLDESRTARLCRPRIALGAVAPKPLFIPAAGEALAGKAISDEAIAEAARIAQKPPPPPLPNAWHGRIPQA